MPIYKVGLAGVMLLTLTANVAWARSEYPAQVQAASGSPCVPRCALCHEDEAGGTVNRPFGITAKSYGLGQGQDQPGGGITVAEVIAQMKTDATDSDHDGVGDIAELAAGTDPNAPGDVSLCGPLVGCGAHIAPAPASGDGGGAWAVALAALAALVVIAAARREMR